MMMPTKLLSFGVPAGVVSQTRLRLVGSMVSTPVPKPEKATLLLVLLVCAFEHSLARSF